MIKLQERVYASRVLAAAFAGLFAASAFGQSTERVNLNTAGGEANALSSRASVSADGRYIAFASDADNLAPADNNGAEDIFVRDTQTGTTIRITINSFGVEADDQSSRPSISADGRFVAFYSDATNLIANDIEGIRDIYVHDRDPDGNGVFDEGNGTHRRVSVSSGLVAGNAGSTRPAISSDGRHVAFRSQATNLAAGTVSGVMNVFAHDLQTSQTVLISHSSGGVEGNAKSDRADVSGDGRFVTFYSDASNLIANDFGGVRDIFAYDRDPDNNGTFDEGNGVMGRVSVSSAGAAGNDDCGRPSISGDGRFVEFHSAADNLVANDTNNAQDEFVHDRLTGMTTRMSVNSMGEQAAGLGPTSNRVSLSADGRYAAFSSDADDLVPSDTNGFEDIFVRDRATGATVRISVDSFGIQGNGTSGRPSISADGRFVAFASDAYNLVGDDEPPFDPDFCQDCMGVRDVFVHDRDPDANGLFDEGNGVTTRVSLSTIGVPADADATHPAISGDGRHVAFRSDAVNLVPNFDNGLKHIYVHDRLTGGTEAVSIGFLGDAGNDNSDRPAISDTGRYITYLSLAFNLVDGDTPNYDPDFCQHCTGAQDIFVFDRDPDNNGVFDEGNGLSVRASIATDGTAGDKTSGRPHISANGRHVTFHSEATNLVIGDTNDHTDVFAHDLFTGQTVRMSVDSSEVQGNYGSDRPAASGDGRFVVYRSKADNLVPGDDPSADDFGCPECTGVRDVFVRDRDPDQNGIYDEANALTIRASVNNAGVSGSHEHNGPTIAADGSTVAFDTGSVNLVPGDTNNAVDVFARDLAASTTQRESVDSAGGQADTPVLIPDSDDGVISEDGRFVAFRSIAINLVDRDYNRDIDVFVRDRDADGDGVYDESNDVTFRASVNTGGAEGNGNSDSPAMAADGSMIAFFSLADNLIADDGNALGDIFVRVTSEPCVADCDENGNVNTLDFLCFLNAFNAGDPRADCDGSGGINTLDFLCFLNAFNAGCP